MIPNDYQRRTDAWCLRALSSTPSCFLAESFHGHGGQAVTVGPDRGGDIPPPVPPSKAAKSPANDLVHPRPGDTQ